MNYAPQFPHAPLHSLQRKNARQLTGLSIVVVVHAVIGFALVSGLTRSPSCSETPSASYCLQTIPPISVVPPVPVVEKILPKSVDIPKQRPVDPIFIPIPFVDPVDSPNIFKNTTNNSTEALPGLIPLTLGPQAMPDAGTGEIARTSADTVSLACPNSRQVRENMSYPAAARREGLQGDVLVRFVVGAGGVIRDINIVNSTNRAFNAASMNAVRQFQCLSQSADVTAEVAFSFKLTN